MASNRTKESNQIASKRSTRRSGNSTADESKPSSKARGGGTTDSENNQPSGAAIATNNEAHSNANSAVPNTSTSTSTYNSSKPSPLETNSITYQSNEFLTGQSSSANPVRRELAIELLGKPTWVVMQTHDGLMSQPASVAAKIAAKYNTSSSSSGGSTAASSNSNQPPSFSSSSSSSSSGNVPQFNSLAASAEIEELPTRVLRQYKLDYRIPIYSAQSFNGYLLNSSIGRKTHTFKKVKNRVKKQELVKAVKRNFANQNVRESEVVVNFIYAVKTQNQAFKYRFNP